jgi:hypothetical protein
VRERERARERERERERESETERERERERLTRNCDVTNIHLAFMTQVNIYLNVAR